MTVVGMCTGGRQDHKERGNSTERESWGKRRD